MLFGEIRTKYNQYGKLSKRHHLELEDVFTPPIHSPVADTLKMLHRHMESASSREKRSRSASENKTAQDSR